MAIREPDMALSWALVSHSAPHARRKRESPNAGLLRGTGSCRKCVGKSADLHTRSTAAGGVHGFVPGSDFVAVASAWRFLARTISISDYHSRLVLGLFANTRGPQSPAGGSDASPCERRDGCRCAMRIVPTCVRAFRARASFRPVHETARPWLFGIAGNLVVDHERSGGDFWVWSASHGLGRRV
jgi:hypothetical protein